MMVGVRRFDSNRPGAILTLKGAFGVQNAVRFVNFRPLPPESRSRMLTDRSLTTRDILLVAL